MLYYSNDYLFFQADEISATYISNSDKTIEFTSSDDISCIKSKSGDDVLIFSSSPINDNDNIPSHEKKSEIIRLILSSPDKDWRQNNTYEWKLSSAWMLFDNEGGTRTSLAGHDEEAGVEGEKDDDDFEETNMIRSSYLFWNIENYIDSKIQSDRSKDNFFSCDSIELNFYSLKQDFSKQIEMGKLIMSNVTLGTQLQLLKQADEEEEEEEEHNSINEMILSKAFQYQQEHHGANCQIVNGEIQRLSNNNDRNKAIESSNYITKLFMGNTITVAIVALIVITISLLLSVFVCRRRRQRLYEQIVPSAMDQHDLVLEEDSHDLPKKNANEKKEIDK